jgi:REP element-mobilizing transposase RayT
VIYGKVRTEIGKILRELCLRKDVEILEAEACPDHIHMLVSIPPKISVSSFMGYLKGKSSLMIFDKFAQMKYGYGNRQFWCRGYFVDFSDIGKSPQNHVRPGKRLRFLHQSARPETVRAIRLLIRKQ